MYYTTVQVNQKGQFQIDTTNVKKSLLIDLIPFTQHSLHCIHTHIYNPGCYELNPTRFPVHTQTPSGLGSGLEK